MRSIPRFLPQRFAAMVLLFLWPALFGMAAGSTETGAERMAQSAPAIAVFVPGVVSGSPIYEMLVAGVEKAAGEYTGTQVKVVEGGFNQAEWETKVTSLAATAAYGLIVTSNPAMPAICAVVASRFPAQKFLLLDGELAGNQAIYTLRYKQREQAYLAGHLAALVAAERGSRRLGLVAGQEYPAMNEVILPGYREGARAVDPDCVVDFRVVGNWYDAARGAELAAGMLRDGAAVILTIAGGANQGVVQAAVEAGAKVIWFDVNGYGVQPGTVVGSAVVRQDKAAYEQTKRYLGGTLPFGAAELVGVAEGYVDFIEDDPDYIAAVGEPVRRKQAALVQRLRTGSLRLDE